MVVLIVSLYPRMIQLILHQFSHWYHNFSISCSTYSKSTKSMKSNGNIRQNEQKFFISFWKKYYFRKCFSNFRSNRRNNATVCETPMLKKYFSSWKKFFLSWHFIENQVFKISTLFPCFSLVYSNYCTQFVQGWSGNMFLV